MTCSLYYTTMNSDLFKVDKRLGSDAQITVYNHDNNQHH